MAQTVEGNNQPSVVSCAPVRNSRSADRVDRNEAEVPRADRLGARRRAARSEAAPHSRATAYAAAWRQLAGSAVPPPLLRLGYSCPHREGRNAMGGAAVRRWPHSRLVLSGQASHWETSSDHLAACLHLSERVVGLHAVDLVGHRLPDGSASHLPKLRERRLCRPGIRSNRFRRACS
jgi:hypothetical protein